MSFLGKVAPTNAVVYEGEPKVDERIVEASAKTNAGRLLKKGTNDDEVVTGTAGCNPSGWSGYEQANPATKPGSRDTDYAQGGPIPVIRGEISLVGILAPGQTITKDQPLCAGANGTVAAISDSEPVAALADESITTTTSEARIMLRSAI